MTVRRWAWLIGMSDAADARLVDWAKSFATPPSLELRGARLDFAGYAPERRAIRLDALIDRTSRSRSSRAALREPGLRVHACAREADVSVTLAGRPLDAERYAWDGRTLWLDATIETPTELRVTFGSHGPLVANTELPHDGALSMSLRTLPVRRLLPAVARGSLASRR